MTEAEQTAFGQKNRISTSQGECKICQWTVYESIHKDGVRDDVEGKSNQRS